MGKLCHPKWMCSHLGFLKHYIVCLAGLAAIFDLNKMLSLFSFGPIQFTAYPICRFDFHICVLSTSGQQVIEEQRRRLAELKQKAAVEAQCQWEALHGSQTQLNSPFSSTSGPVVHHSILHHTALSSGEQPYDTLSLESSDSMDTSISTGNNSACSPDNMSRFDISICFPQSLSLSALLLLTLWLRDRNQWWLCGFSPHACPKLNYHPSA